MCYIFKEARMQKYNYSESNYFLSHYCDVHRDGHNYLINYRPECNSHVAHARL